MKWVTLALLTVACVWGQGVAKQKQKAGRTQYAQEVCSGVATWREDFQIEHVLLAEGWPGANVPIPGDYQRFCGARHRDKVLIRELTIRAGVTFGYEVHVTRNDTGKPFHVQITPVEGAEKMQYFVRSPQPVDVGPEDAVEFVLFTYEDGDSSMRLIERYWVRDYRPLISRIAREGTTLHLRGVRVRRNGQEIGVVLGADVSGASVWVYVPGAGRFWFSMRQTPGPRGTITGNQLEFQWGGVHYAVECSGPVVDGAGDWAVPMRLESGWRPEPRDLFNTAVDPNVVTVGAQGGLR